MRVVLMVASLFVSFAITAQTKKAYIVHAGEVPAEVLPVEALYSFPHFKKGIVFLRDGTATSQMLNYNLLLDEMHFISATNDTLAIATPETVKSVVLDSTSFYFDKNYFQVLWEAGAYKLAIKQFLLQTTYGKRSAYGISTSISSIETYSSTYYNGQMFKLEIKKDVEMEKKSMYFISDRFNHFYPAEKKYFYKVFPNKKAELDSFLKEHPVNFQNQKELIELINICIAS
jgi:hypothetical protein